MRKQSIVMLIMFFFMVGSAAASCANKIQLAGVLDVAAVSVNEFFPKGEGTFILKDLESEKMFIYNNERAKEQRTPNSTFKIMNSLIGLQVKAVKDEYEIKHWDGTKRTLDNWNQDHTLGSGMRNSVVWYYQEMARDIGEGVCRNGWTGALMEIVTLAGALIGFGSIAH